MHKPTDSVRVVIFDETDPSRFLVITEADDRGNWKLPGGKFEKGQDGIESPDDAAKRELQEELRVNGEQVNLRVAETLVNDDGVSMRYIYAAMARPAVINPTDEIAEAEWFTQLTLPECKNSSHILSAVATARIELERNNTP